jgi:hypothetical protein
MGSRVAKRSTRWTPKGAIARSRKNLDGAIERLRSVAHEWGDVDQTIVDESESLISELADFADRIESDTNARLEAGEHVGL